MTELSDLVVAAARAGDPEAVGTVYATLSPGVHGFLRVRGAEDPEGLTSEVFVQVIGRLGAFRGGAAELRTFVFAVAHARLVDEIRRRARRPGSTPYDADLDGRETASAETIALEKDGTRNVMDVLERLNDDQRAVVTLRVLGDLTLDQTAEVLGRSTGAVKQLQRRGLLTLRALVDRGEVTL